MSRASKSPGPLHVTGSRLHFHRCVEERRPYFPNQKDVNDLIRGLGLTKCNAELLISRLKEWNLLDESVQVTDTEKASRNTFQLLQSARWAVFLQQCGRSIRGYIYHL